MGILSKLGGGSDPCVHSRRPGWDPCSASTERGRALGGPVFRPFAPGARGESCEHAAWKHAAVAEWAHL
eukprot:9095669-Pyramimonas_sp.AAC.1